MSQHGSYAGRDDTRSVSNRSRTTTSLSVSRKREDRGPPIAFNNRHSVDAGSSSNGRSRSRSGSVRTPSVASDSTARQIAPPPRSVSRHRKGPESVSSDRTARPSKPRARESDTESYTSEQYPKVMVPEEGRGSVYEEDWRAGRSVYLREKPRDRTAPSEASGRTPRSTRDMERLSEETGSLSINDHMKVAKWNEEVKRDTKGDRWNGNPTSGLESDNGEDNYREGSNAPSHDGYQESLHSERLSHTSKQSRDRALEVYRDPDAQSYTSRSHHSSAAPSRSSQSHHSYASSAAPSRTSRNPPPPHSRGTYVERADYSRTHVTHETHIHGPGTGFMDGPTKRDLRRMEKMREHELDMAMIDRGMVPHVRKGFWD